MIQVEDRAGQSRHGLPDRTAVRCDDAVALVRFTGDAVQRIGWIARWRVGSPWSPPTRTESGTGDWQGRFAETDTADPVLILTEVPTP